MGVWAFAAVTQTGQTANARTIGHLIVDLTGCTTDSVAKTDTTRISNFAVPEV